MAMKWICLLLALLSLGICIPGAPNTTQELNFWTARTIVTRAHTDRCTARQTEQIQETLRWIHVWVRIARLAINRNRFTANLRQHFKASGLRTRRIVSERFNAIYMAGRDRPGRLRLECRDEDRQCNFQNFEGPAIVHTVAYVDETDILIVIVSRSKYITRLNPTN